MDNQTKTNLLLKELYTEKWEALSEVLLSFNEEDPGDDENKATHPMLLKVNEEYENADVKVMIFGQETNGWNDFFDEDSQIEPLLDLYQKFYLDKEYEDYGKAFWNYIKNLKARISTNIPKEVGYVWNNVLKIGKCESGTPQNGLINYTLQHFNVIPQEIEILKPDVLLFFSGPNYDEHIRKMVGNYSTQPIEKFSPQEFCKLNFSNIPVKLALRTYHPGAHLKSEKRDDISNTIINLIQEI